MWLPEQEQSKQPVIDKKLAKRQLWIEYIKGAVTVFIFLIGLALVTNFYNGYFTVNFGYLFGVHSGYRNIVLILCLVVYIILFISLFKRLGFKTVDRIDELKAIIDGLD